MSTSRSAGSITSSTCVVASPSFMGMGVKARGTMSAIGRLTLKMLGSLSTPVLHSKAAECRN